MQVHEQKGNSPVASLRLQKKTMCEPRNPGRSTKFVPKSGICLQTDRYQAYYLGKVNAAGRVK